MSAPPRSRFATIETTLQEISEQGGFSFTALTDADGFAIITVQKQGCCEPDLFAAVAARVQRSTVQVKEQLAMPDMDEISIYYTDKQRLVYRPFEANGQYLILSVIVPDQGSYRQLTNRAISTIKREWQM